MKATGKDVITLSAATNQNVQPILNMLYHTIVAHRLEEEGPEEAKPYDPLA